MLHSLPTPSPYLRAIRDHLQDHEPHLWAWYRSDEISEEYAEKVRLELLKRTYRLDRELHQELYRALDEVALKLALTVPITLYRGGDDVMGAALYFLPDAAHLVLQGPITERLDAEELRSILGHELAHDVLWRLDDGSLHTTQRVLAELAADERTDPAYRNACRLFNLYVEIFADRGGCVASAEGPAITALIKVCTGARMVSAEGYLKQAREVVATGVRSEAISHPEVFIRALAVHHWARETDGHEAAIRDMVEGAPPLEELDPLRRLELTSHTRQILDHVFAPAWMRTETLLAHARKFFHDFEPSDQPEALLALPHAAPSVRHFLAHLLLDFAAADEQLDDNPLLVVHALACQLGLRVELENAANKEMKITRKALTKLRTERDVRLEKLLEVSTGEGS